MNIVYCFSKNWLHYIKIQIHSLLVNNQNESIKFYLMTDKLSNDEMNEMICVFEPFKNCELIFIDMTKYAKLFNKTNVDNRFTKYTLYRLLIPKLIPEKKVLYLDSDTLVVGSLKELYDLNVESVIGVVDKNIEKYADKSLKLNYTSYINAGVILMNLDELKVFNDEWINMCNTRKYPCHDQDIINLTCKPELIGNEWNSSVSTGIAKINKINIYHWAGKKPWERNHWLWKIAENRYSNFITKQNIIPKVIFTCWFGDNEKNELIEKCNQSIKTFMIDYQVVECSQDNFDITCCNFVKDAYNNKKYAFISDYVRVWVLNKFGGLYFDSDVEVLKRLDDFLDNVIFTGKETNDLWATAVMGCITEYEGLQELVDYYDKKEFSLTEKPNTQLLSDFFKKTKEAKIYDVDTFCPFDHKMKIVTPTKNTYTIHHFNGSWKKDNPIKKQSIDFDFLNYYQLSDWNMENYEKIAIYYLLQNMKNKNNALIIGSVGNDLLNILSQNFKQVVTIDSKFENLDKNLFNNVKFIENTCNPNALLNLLNLMDVEPFSFVLFDDQHDYKYINTHMEILKLYIPRNDMFILIHDTWYQGTRQALKDVNWNDNKYIHFIDLDFCPGVKIKGNRFVGGLGLVIMKNIGRINDVALRQMKYHYKVATK